MRCSRLSEWERKWMGWNVLHFWKILLFRRYDKRGWSISCFSCHDFGLLYWSCSSTWLLADDSICWHDGSGVRHILDARAAWGPFHCVLLARWSPGNGHWSGVHRPLLERPSKENGLRVRLVFLRLCSVLAQSIPQAPNLSYHPRFQDVEGDCSSGHWIRRRHFLGYLWKRSRHLQFQRAHFAFSSHREDSYSHLCGPHGRQHNGRLLLASSYAASGQHRGIWIPCSVRSNRGLGSSNGFSSWHSFPSPCPCQLCVHNRYSRMLNSMDHRSAEQRAHRRVHCHNRAGVFLFWSYNVRWTEDSGWHRGERGLWEF